MILPTLFRPPAWMTLPSLSIAVTATQVRYAALDRVSERGITAVREHGMVQTPQDLFEQGEITDPMQLSRVIKDVTSRTHSNLVRIVLPETHAYIFELPVSARNQKDPRSFIEFHLEEHVPLAGHEVAFSYTPVRDKKRNRIRSLVVTAYHKSVIAQYHEACLAVGIQPIRFDVDVQVMHELIPTPATTNGATMLLSIGDLYSTIGISHGGVLLYTTTVPMGGIRMFEALRQVLGTDATDTELSQLQNEFGVLQQDDDDPQVHEAILPIVSAIKDEVMSRIEYWNSIDPQKSDRSIQQMYITGSYCNINHLPTYFTEVVGVETKFLPVLHRLYPNDKVVPPITASDALRFSGVIGSQLIPNQQFS